MNLVRGVNVAIGTTRTWMDGMGEVLSCGTLPIGGGYVRGMGTDAVEEECLYMYCIVWTGQMEWIDGID